MMQTSANINSPLAKVKNQNYVYQFNMYIYDYKKWFTSEYSLTWNM